MFRKTLFCALALGLALGFSACDNDDDSDSHEHHMEAIGVALVQDGDTLIKAASADAAEVVGEIHVHEGESTGAIQVHFLDEEGNWFRPEADPDGEHALDAQFNESALGVTVDQVDWTVALLGVAAGETSLVIKILHDGHADYVSPALPVTVAQP